MTGYHTRFRTHGFKSAVWALIGVVLGTSCSELPETHLSKSLSGYTVARLAEALDSGESDALVVVSNDKPLVTWGEIDAKINVASVRKSLISALYGIAIEKKLIDPASTLADLDINDRSNPLTRTEAQATVMNLLQARSGIYLPTLGESPGMIERKPARGSAGPGELFYYNNWDFNVLGTIFEKQTGMALGSAFAEWIALPIGMEDFEPADVHYQADEISGHRMYRFYMSARDLARFGRLYTSHGKWGTQSIIPEEWVAATFTKYSEVSYSSSADGYGLLWLIDSAANVFIAEGSGGQFLFVSPDRNLVMVTLNDRGISFLGRKLHNPLAKSASYTEAKRLWDIVLADISARSF